MRSWLVVDLRVEYLLITNWLENGPREVGSRLRSFLGELFGELFGKSANGAK